MPIMRYRIIAELGAEERDAERIALFEQMKTEGGMVSVIRQLLDREIEIRKTKKS